jgi:hypothetical protein
VRWLSLSETIRFGSLEFITDYLSGLSLSPRRNDSGATFMGSARSGSSSPLWVMREDSTEEFFMASSEEGGGGLRPPLFLKAQHGGFVCSHRNHTMARGRSDHSGHDNSFAAGAGTSAEHRPPL